MKKNKALQYLSAINYFLNLNQEEKDKRGVFSTKFNYFLLMNLNKIQPEADMYKKMIGESEELKQFEKKRISLLQEYAQKKEDGSFVLDKNEVQLKEETKETFRKEFEKLREEYKDTIESHNKKAEEVSKIYEAEEFEVELFKISLEELPANLSYLEVNDLIYFGAIKD